MDGTLVKPDIAWVKIIEMGVSVSWHESLDIFISFDPAPDKTKTKCLMLVEVSVLWGEVINSVRK